MQVFIFLCRKQLYAQIVAANKWRIQYAEHVDTTRDSNTLQPNKHKNPAMKTPDDPRHLRRKRLIEELFKSDFHPQRISPTASRIVEQRDFIDTHIKKAAPEFPIDKINKIDLAILRLAVYELLVEKKEPPNVIIDEAVELAKEYGGDTSPAFVNGALGNIVEK